VFSADRTKSALAITEIRLRPAKSADPTWDGATELGLAVVAHTLHIGDGKMTVVPDPVAVISLHALARRIQRGFRQDDAAVLEDIACPRAGESSLLRWVRSLRYGPIRAPRCRVTNRVAHPRIGYTCWREL